MHFTATFRAHPPLLAAGVQHFFFDNDEPPAVGSRPDRIATLSGPQERDLRRTVQILDHPVPQMEQLPDVMRLFRLTSACSRAGSRSTPRSCSTMYLCVLLHVIRSLRNSRWKCRRSYPIPGCRYEWSRTSIFQFLVVEREFLVFKVFFPDRVQQRRLSRRSLTFPVEVLKVLILDRVRQCLHSPAGSDDDADEPGKGVFRTFPQNKKSAKLASHSGSELLPESSPSTPAAQLEVSVEWVRLRERHAGKIDYWNRRTNSTVWLAPDGVEVVWYGEKDEKGGVWYWHRDTRVSTFDLPPLPPERGAVPPAQGGI